MRKLESYGTESSPVSLVEPLWWWIAGHRESLRDHPSQRLMIKCLKIIQIELEMLVFEENRITRRKISRSKEENQQQTQPTFDAGSGNRTQDTLVGGERSYHCTIPAAYRHFLLGLLQRGTLLYFWYFMSSNNNEFYLPGHKRELKYCKSILKITRIVIKVNQIIIKLSIIDCLALINRMIRIVLIA